MALFRTTTPEPRSSMEHCSIRIAIGHFDEIKGSWNYQRLPTSLQGTKALHNDFDATLATPSHERLGRAVDFLTSLGYAGFEELLAEHYVVTKLKMKDERSESPQTLMGNDLPTLETNASNTGGRQGREPNGSTKAQVSRPEAMQPSRPRTSIPTSSSDLDEPAALKVERTNNDRAARPAGQFAKADGITEKRSSDHQIARTAKNGVQPYRIWKPLSSQRREPRAETKKRVSEIQKSESRSKLYRTVASSTFKVAVDAGSVKRSVVPEIIDLCSTDSENMPQ